MVLALAWGPAVGAKVVPFQVAAPVGAVCVVIGAVLFGDRKAHVYGGFLHDLSDLQDLPEMTLFAMFWGPFVMLIWQAVALWWKVPIVPYLGFGRALFPSAAHCTYRLPSALTVAVSVLSQWPTRQLTGALHNQAAVRSVPK